MKRLIVVAIIPVFMSGCSGLDIKSMTLSEVQAARVKDNKKPLDGYVIYEPMTVVEISSKAVCQTTMKDGKCEGASKIQCAASLPFQLPDYSKPYLIKSRTGLGKAGVDVTITDGWKLGGIKDSSDNSAILSFIEKGVFKSFTEDKSTTCKEPGLYKLTPKLDDHENVSFDLEALKLYQ